MTDSGFWVLGSGYDLILTRAVCIMQLYTYYNVMHNLKSLLHYNASYVIDAISYFEFFAFIHSHTTCTPSSDFQNVTSNSVNFKVIWTIF